MSKVVFFLLFVAVTPTKSSSAYSLLSFTFALLFPVFIPVGFKKSSSIRFLSGSSPATRLCQVNRLIHSQYLGQYNIFNFGHFIKQSFDLLTKDISVIQVSRFSSIGGPKPQKC
ncbi:MAG: hypothetical protein IPG18_15355 [Saprospiraceae bacterium]|nr:hypothetical protein [Saprospiraceae bacterium]